MARAIGGSGRRLALLIAVALATRWAVFGNPVVHVDESFYLTVARAMLRGAVPFVDIWDRKPIGLFLVYLPAALLPLGQAVIAYQMLATACVVATAWLIAAMADRLGWQRGALAAGVAYILLLNLAGGQGGQAPVFFNTLMAGAGALILANPERRWSRDAAAMLLVGCALQVKYSVVFEGVYFGLVCVGMGRGRRVGPLVPRTVALAALALLPTAVAIGAYAVLGALPAFLFANFESVLLRASDPAGERIARLATIAAILAPLIGMGIAAARWHALTPGRRFVFGWFAVALGGIAVFGGWLDHYALPAMLPGTLASAGFFSGVAERRWPAVLVLGAAAVGAQVVMLANRAGRGDVRQFSALAAAVDQAPPGCILVYSGPALLYPATGRCAMSRFVFPNHLYKIAEAPAIGADQVTEVKRILSRAPAAIVMRPWTPGERRDVRALVERAVRTAYSPAGRFALGHERLAVYFRKATR